MEWQLAKSSFHVARNWLVWLARTVSQHNSRWHRCRMSLAMPRCIPPSDGCPRIIASTRLLHTERRFGITLAAAANGPMGKAAINKKQRDTKGTTNYPGLLANHQHPTVILKKKISHNDQGWHWNHENFKNDCNKKLETIILFNTADCLDGTTNACASIQLLHTGHPQLPQVTYAAASVRTTPIASSSPRIEKQALMLVSLLVSLLVCHVRNQRHLPWPQLHDPRNSKRDQRSWAIQA